MPDYSQYIQKIKTRQIEREANSERLLDQKEEVLRPVSVFALELKAANCIAATEFTDSNYDDLVVSFAIAKTNQVLGILVKAETKDDAWGLVVDARESGDGVHEFYGSSRYEEVYDFVSDLIAEHG